MMAVIRAPQRQEKWLRTLTQNYCTANGLDDCIKLAYREGELVAYLDVEIAEVFYAHILRAI